MHNIYFMLMEGDGYLFSKPVLNIGRISNLLSGLEMVELDIFIVLIVRLNMVSSAICVIYFVVSEFLFFFFFLVLVDLNQSLRHVIIYFI